MNNIHSLHAQILDAVGDAIILTDLTGEIQYWNRAAEKLYQWKADEMIGSSIWAAIPSESNQQQTQEIIETLRKGETWQGEFQSQRKDGSAFWVHINVSPVYGEDGELTGTIGASRDISEQRELRKSLQNSEKKYRTLYNNAPLAYQSLDENGCIIDINPAWLKTLGYKKDEVLGVSFANFLSPNGKPHFEKNFPAFKKRGYVHDIQFELLHKEGHPMYVSFEGAIGENSDGSFQQTYCVFQNISERKKVEDALRTSEKRFQYAMEATQDGLFDWNLVTNEIYYSLGWKSMLGYAYHELPNDFSIWERLTSPEDVQRSWQMQTELINKQRERFEMEFKMKHKDGHWVDILSRASAVFNEEGEAIRIVGMHVDISERKRTEKELLEHRNHLEELVQERTQEIEAKMLERQVLFDSMIGREVRMAGLKDAIEKLRAQLIEAGLKPVANDPLLPKD